jgi:hypothetical protein
VRNQAASTVIRQLTDWPWALPVNEEPTRRGEEERQAWLPSIRQSHNQPPKQVPGRHGQCFSDLGYLEAFDLWLSFGAVSARVCTQGLPIH